MEKIYPDGGRINCFSKMYCEIAMESYYKAMKSYDLIKDNDFSWDSYDELDRLNKSIVSTIIFSAMAIESFINNYAAACLGDSEFYDNFDRLSIISKFELIARFILNSEINKSASYYYRLKILFRNRDYYVHNKSRKMSFLGYTWEEIQTYDAGVESGEIKEGPHILDKKEIDDDIRSAIESLKAIKDIAIYFDQYDSNIFALYQFFHPMDIEYASPQEKEYRIPILALLGIKVKSDEI